MSWDAYIDQMMANAEVQACAILGLKDGAMWAASPMYKNKITPDEFKAITTSNRGELFTKSLTIAGVKCTLLRDSLNDVGTMDMRTKATETDSNTYSICIAKSTQTLIFVQAKKDVHGGAVNKIAFDMVEYLKKMSY